MSFSAGQAHLYLLLCTILAFWCFKQVNRCSSRFSEQAIWLVWGKKIVCQPSLILKWMYFLWWVHETSGDFLKPCEWPQLPPNFFPKEILIIYLCVLKFLYHNLMNYWEIMQSHPHHVSIRFHLVIRADCTNSLCKPSLICLIPNSKLKICNIQFCNLSSLHFHA